MLNKYKSKFSYDGTFEGFLSVVDYCIANKTMPSHIRTVYRVQETLSTNEYMRIPTNYSLADRIYRITGRHSSPEVQQMMSDCFLTCLTDMEMDLFMMICKAIKYGAVIAEDYKDELMQRIQFAIRDLYREAHSVISNMSVTRIDEVTFSMINPRNNVLPIIQRAILNNPEYDDFIVYDKRHNIALIRIGENYSIIDVKRIMSGEITTIDDLRLRIWTYFKETTNMPSRDVRTRRAESLTCLWYIAS